MGFKNSNYTGIAPNTVNQPAYNQPTYNQPMMQQQAYQPSQNALQINVNKFRQLIPNVVSYKFQRGDLNQNAANMCSQHLYSAANNGVYNQRIWDNFGNTIADDNRLCQLIEYCIAEWVQQATNSGMSVLGVSQQQPWQQGYQPMMQQQPMQYDQWGRPIPQNCGQPMFFQQQQPMMQQPMMQQQPTWLQQQQYNGQQYNGNTQLYGNNTSYTQYNNPMRNSFNTDDSIYGNKRAVAQSSMYSSAPTQTVTGNQVHTQAPQVSTWKANYNNAQHMSDAERKKLITPTNAMSKKQGNNAYNVNHVQEQEKQYIPVSTNPKVVNLTQEEINKLYPKDEYNFREKYFEFVKLMKLEYDKHIYLAGGEPKGIKGEDIDAQIIELKEESAPSNMSAIKRVVSANKGHDATKPFIYKIGYNKEVVVDIPYVLASSNHSEVQKVWSEFTDSDDSASIYKVLDTKPFDVAKAIITKFKKTHPQYQKVIEPTILDLYNNVINTASVVRSAPGKFIKMNPAESVDDIYNACCLADDSTYGTFKTLLSYSTILMNALNNSLFAVYNPLMARNYLNYNHEKDRATALANPDIGVMVSYVTDRHLSDAKSNGKPVDDKKLKNLVDNELKQHFVLLISRCTIYTNLEMPYAKKPTKLSFAPAVMDTKNGLTNIFGLTAFTQTLGSVYAPANVCVPEIILANDRTTEKVPYIVVSTMDDNAFISRVVAV